MRQRVNDRLASRPRRNAQIPADLEQRQPYIAPVSNPAQLRLEEVLSVGLTG
jgi:hypothetical protein